jgi:hypothetical protein
MTGSRAAHDRSIRAQLLKFLPLNTSQPEAVARFWEVWSSGSRAACYAASSLKFMPELKLCFWKLLHRKFAW